MKADTLEDFLTLDLEDRLKLMLRKIPMYRNWDIEILESTVGYVKFLLPFKEEFIGNFIAGYWHGGMLSAVCDTAGGFAAAAQLYPNLGIGMISTIDLRIDYLKSVEAKDIVVDAKVIRAAKRSLFIDMTIKYIDSEEILTMGRGVFNLRKSEYK